MRSTASSVDPRPSIPSVSTTSTRTPHEADARFFLHYGDLTDATNLIRLVQEVRPDEIYNLAAQSHVHVSFETPEYTANSDALGTLRLLEALRILNRTGEIRYYQASTSELFGNAPHAPQNEATPFSSPQPVCGRQALRLLDHGLTIVRHMDCTPPMAFCSTTKDRREARRS